jgi:hypothetical protein
MPEHLQSIRLDIVGLGRFVIISQKLLTAVSDWLAVTDCLQLKLRR